MKPWTPEREAAALARCEAASVGWRLVHPGEDGAIARTYDGRDAKDATDRGEEPDDTDDVSLCCGDEDLGGRITRLADAEFIVAAREDLPDAIAEINRLTPVVLAYERLVGTLAAVSSRPARLAELLDEASQVIREYAPGFTVLLEEIETMLATTPRGPSEEVGDA